MSDEQKEPKEAEGAKAKRSDKWREIRATLHSMIDEGAGDLYSELVLRGQNPNLQIRYSGGNEVDILILCPIAGELDRSRLQSLLNIADLFSCEVEISLGPSQESPFGVVFYGFMGGEDGEEESKQDQGEDTSGDEPVDIQSE